MNWISGLVSLVDVILKNIGGGDTHEVRRETVKDPILLEQLSQFEKENAELSARYQNLVTQMKDKEIDSFEDLQKFDEKGAETLVKLALQTSPLSMQGTNFGFFGLTSTGKSTIINKLIGKNLADVGAGETTKEIKSYEGQGYRLYDIPGRNDDLSYFTLEYIAFWKALTSRIVVITSTVKEMTKVFRLLDAINLKYDIIVNKFDSVKFEERENFKCQLKQQIIDCKLQGVKYIWFISAQNTNQFPDWNYMIEYLQKS